MAVVTPLVQFRLHTYARSITKDSGAADLVVADAISKCAQRIDPLKVPKSKIAAYLKMAVRNSAITWLRHHQNENAYLEICHEQAARSAFAEAVSREAMKVFDEVVAKLPRGWRRIVTLRIVDQLPFPEIAKRTRTKLNTVLTRFFRAKERLWRFIEYVKAE